ncbi:MAG TPA: prolyl oligopeptidase family serine peptidase [Candidatus Acidoferrales bacterium]|nr:prolyl oligopeptidase family serine peptidase [Candidatus Acidoferrales bacterium]
MPGLAAAVPFSPVEAVTEVLHGVPVTDPYRWLEDQDSPRTRQWLEDQARYARACLENISGREGIRKRIREFLAIETYDSVQKAGHRYFFRKRLPNEEQPCLYMREGPYGEDQLLVDPSAEGQGIHTAVKPLRASADGRLLLYEIKQGGERTGTFALFDVETRRTLPDVLPRGYLRGFAFAPDGKSFYYAHEASDAERPFYRAAYHHVLGTPFSEDREIFCAGEDANVRLCLASGATHLGFLVYRFGEKTQTDFFLKPFPDDRPPEAVFAGAAYSFGPLLVLGKILAITDRDAPNLRIVELRLRPGKEPEWVDLVPETEARIHEWAVAGERIFVSYIRQTAAQVQIFDFTGKKTGEVPVRDGETIRLRGAPSEGDELIVETESFTEPISIFRHSADTGRRTLWSRKRIPFDSGNYEHAQVWYSSKDGTRVPMFLLGRRDVLARGRHPTILTAYGGYGISMTPQFSVFVAFLIERGCLFALPNIRGGSEFGAAWHQAAKRRNRQNAYDDFLGAAEWLIRTERTAPGKLAIFGGSNSGLLVGVAMTQRPDLFRAVVCIAPMLDMLRYHRFDNAHVWREEFGTAEDPDDFLALSGYSPYHHVREGAAYPATMIVSGDADRNCNALHARKMTARLQAANASEHPILLAYSPFRGHSPVLPLSERIESLTDRMAFLCDQLGLPV